jgi:hypothetical protein
MKFKRKIMEPVSIAFLSVITCCFGAIILLLVVSAAKQTERIEDPTDPRISAISQLQRQLFKLQKKSKNLLEIVQKQTIEIDNLRTKNSNINKKITAGKSHQNLILEETKLNALLSGELKIAHQTLTAEMRRLYREIDRKKTNLVGGIPIDSEYIIFVIDTSGSMFRYAWPKVIAQIEDTLRVYPEVKGIQILNDMGSYMFATYRGEWIPDSPDRRQAISERLKTWNAFSNSSPAEGITEAIRAFNSQGKKISIYVYGDEFTGESIRKVVAYVSEINHRDNLGEPLVRIHAIGFPVQFAQPPDLQHTGIRFATLMRELTRKNGGTFVGLNSFR